MLQGLLLDEAATSPSPPHHLPTTSPSPPHHPPSPPHHLPIPSPSPQETSTIDDPLLAAALEQPREIVLPKNEKAAAAAAAMWGCCRAPPKETINVDFPSELPAGDGKDNALGKLVEVRSIP